MSRIGKKPVQIPSNVTATVEGQKVKVKGPKGELQFSVPDAVSIKKTDDGIELAPANETKQAQSLWGMSRTQVANLVSGVTEGYSRTLEISGVGYRAAKKGKDLQLNVGYSHEVVHPIPKGIDIEVAGAKQEIIKVSGIDKQLVGQVAAEIRAYRPPEPYQGKGIRYSGEYIFRKEGKKK